MAEPTRVVHSSRESLAAAGRRSVVVDDLHVTYRTYIDRRPTLRKLLTSRSRGVSYRDVHAVRGVSLTAVPGDLVGIIGPNGSGKSTLLRAITGLLPATRGAVYARARPVLLGVSAALQDALSGNDNITLGCTALGMRRSEVEDHRDRIVEFAGLGEFIDMPMRAYSSGMKARLSFAIATSVTPEILLVDEALSVGDEEFKRKSQERLDELLAAAGCIFVVSHNLGFVRDNATRVIWLDHGRIVMDGPPDDVVNSYRERVTAQRSHDADAEHHG